MWANIFMPSYYFISFIPLFVQSAYVKGVHESSRKKYSYTYFNDLGPVLHFCASCLMDSFFFFLSEKRFLLESSGGDWGRQRAVSQERGRQKSQAPKGRASLVWSGEGWGCPGHCAPAPTRLIHCSEWHQAFSVSGSYQKVIQIPEKEFPLSCLGPLPTS